uniref:(northern house mosquito) hypothetical protein n=1 Tax=Culex pipiens TaxID=7175 RepID=A0A8D8HIG1_CULPI
MAAAHLRQIRWPWPRRRLQPALNARPRTTLSQKRKFRPSTRSFRPSSTRPTTAVRRRPTDRQRRRWPPWRTTNGPRWAHPMGICAAPAPSCRPPATVAHHRQTKRSARLTLATC